MRILNIGFVALIVFPLTVNGKTPPEGEPCLSKGECKKNQYCLPIKFGEQSYCVDKDKKCPQRLRWSKTAPESVRGQCYTVPVEVFPTDGADDKDIKKRR